MVIAADTERLAHEAQLDALRRLGPEGRVAIAAKMSDEAREIVAAGIKNRHPEYSVHQVRMASFRVFLGDEIVHQIWGDEGMVEP